MYYAIETEKFIDGLSESDREFFYAFLKDFCIDVNDRKSMNNAIDFCSTLFKAVKIITNSQDKLIARHHDVTTLFVNKRVDNALNKLVNYVANDAIPSIMNSHNTLIKTKEAAHRYQMNFMRFYLVIVSITSYALGYMA